MKNEFKMNIDDLALWYMNFAKRLKIAKDLGCSGSPGCAEWTCCIVHQNFNNESLHMQEVARRLHPSEEKGRIFSRNWWEELNQHEAAKYS